MVKVIWTIRGVGSDTRTQVRNYALGASFFGTGVARIMWDYHKKHPWFEVLRNGKVVFNAVK